jgi:hypothetical protein
MGLTPEALDRQAPLIDAMRDIAAGGLSGTPKRPPARLRSSCQQTNWSGSQTFLNISLVNRGGEGLSLRPPLALRHFRLLWKNVVNLSNGMRLTRS